MSRCWGFPSSGKRLVPMVFTGVPFWFLFRCHLLPWFRKRPRKMGEFLPRQWETPARSPSKPGKKPEARWEPGELDSREKTRSPYPNQFKMSACPMVFHPGAVSGVPRRPKTPRFSYGRAVESGTLKTNIRQMSR
ncbi:hypothetical protein MPNT_20136 [Candidatus Methylacidithermus pantelleriae]|uniref:Uncharacterized protein n=1 Tax=Candidatus Methylacidithermus pantelleriae TaxID=2744239 RepID=A0A8J2BLF5_9BACT|nr:hypothetical protein MPNT_20136 [Candidatus Methylacidithermus pantelleriae]